MTSPLLALFIRSVREDCRLKFTYFSRAGLVLLILLFLVEMRISLGWTSAPGLQFFTMVAEIDLWFVALAGLSYFAATISEEKEEMTLGLLRMTNLNPISILLGKSTSRLCNTALLFAAQFPFTLLAITLGGISLRQIVTVYLTVGAFLVLVANLALFASVLCRRTSGAAIFTAVSLLVFFTSRRLAGWFGRLPVQLGWWDSHNRWTTSLTHVAKFFEDASPFMQVERILGFDHLYRFASFQVWSNLGLGAGFFLLAWLVFEKTCGEQKESAPGMIGVGRISRRRRLFSPGRAWTRALAWKDFYFTTGGRLWVLIKLVLYGVPLAAWFFWPEALDGPPTRQQFGQAAFWFMLAAMVFELALAAATLFRNEHQGQTLSSLAMLPQGLRWVTYQKILGVLPALSAAGLYFCVGLSLTAKPFLTAAATWDWHRRQTWENLLPGPFVLCFVLFFLHLVAVLSLHVKRGALPLAIGIQILIFIVMTTISAVFRDIRDSETTFLILVMGAALVAAVFLHWHIGRRLAALAAES